MKLTPLFILLWVFVWVGNAVFAQATVGREEIRLVATDDEDTSDDGTREDPIHHEEPAYMSLLPQQPYAYLYTNKVVVSFDSACQNVRICIINNDTEAVAFEDVYVGSPEISIRLEERGDYTLKVCADGTKWEGWFVY